MKLETYLNAYIAAWTQYDWWVNRRKHRQMKAFRARILRMDAEKDKRIRGLVNYVDELIEEKYE